MNKIYSRTLCRGAMSTPSSPLCEALQSPVSLQAQAEIISSLWSAGTANLSRSDNADWAAYFAYYTAQCNAALVREGIYLSVRTHEGLLGVARLLEDEPCEADVKQKLRQRLTQQRSEADEKKMLDGSVRLAARLLAMVNVGPLPSELSDRICLPWHQGSLQQAIHDHFNTPPEVNLDAKEDIIATDLTCRNIDRVSGIEMVPTDNLLDHLRLVDKDKKLCVFHHVSFLRRMKAVKT